MTHGRKTLAGGVAAVLALVVGLVGMAGIVTIAYGGSEFSLRWSYRLGLPGVLLASALMQMLILAGGWAIWRRLHPAQDPK